MLGFIRVFVILLCLFAAPLKAEAQNFQSLWSDFDSSTLTTDDKRFLQAALAFEGHYLGLLDGAWGKMSRDAFERYSRAEFGSSAEDWHMAILAFDYFDRFEADGWQVDYFEPFGVSLLLPQRAMTVEEPSEHFVNWRHNRSSVSFSIGRHVRPTAMRFHAFTENWHTSSEDPYIVRKDRLVVTFSKKRDGSVLYTRSDFVQQGWTTIMLSADRNDVPILNAVASSIALGRSAPIMFTEGGRLEKVVLAALDVIEENKKGSSGVTEVSKYEPEPEEKQSSTGSGFFVSGEGHVITNAHVVEGCTRVAVNGVGAEVVDISGDFDLALLKASLAEVPAVATFSGAPAKLNSDVTAIGYPYAGLLGGLNVTRGAVSSLSGVAGDFSTLQITAPVQSGNSGGPLISSNGEIVGVVVSKLDARAIADLTGDMPQNVNFAIRGEIAKLYLSQNGVSPILGEGEEPLAPEDLAERAQKFTTFIECD